MQYVVMQNQKNMTISPLKNVFLTPVENQCYSMYKIIKKYYPCMKIYFLGYENRFSMPCVFRFGRMGISGKINNKA